MGAKQSINFIKTFYTTTCQTDPRNVLGESFNFEGLDIPEFIDKFWDKNAQKLFELTNIQEIKKKEDVDANLKVFQEIEGLILPNLAKESFDPTKVFKVSSKFLKRSRRQSPNSQPGYDNQVHE